MDIFDLPLNTTHLRHYTKYIALIKDISFKRYNREVNSVLASDLGKVWTRRRIIHRLLEKYGINDQRSAEWHSKRSEMITASEVTKAFKTATPSARRELILKKIEGAKDGDGSGMNTACAWGTQFEPIAKYLYCKLNGGGEVVDTSCVVHPVHKFLGASPDGIYFTENRSDLRWGKLIEFKCPISRKFDENTPIPDAYYHQMQMQMECTNIDECDYVEMRFVTMTQTEWSTSDAPFKGRFAIYDSGKVLYDNELSPSWRKSLPDDDEFRVIHWALGNWRMANVKRDYTWLPTHIDELKSTWDEILHHRDNGTVPEKMEKVNETVRCELQIVRPAPPETVLPPVTHDLLPVDCSSSVHKKNAKTLSFDLD